MRRGKRGEITANINVEAIINPGIYARPGKLGVPRNGRCSDITPDYRWPLRFSAP